MPMEHESGPVPATSQSSSQFGMRVLIGIALLAMLFTIVRSEGDGGWKLAGAALVVGLVGGEIVRRLRMRRGRNHE